MDYYEEHFTDLMSVIERDKNDLHNKSIPGLGKTTSTALYIAADIKINRAHRWIIAVPTHRLITGESNILSMFPDSINIAHIKGKSKDNEFFTENRCYLEGCSKCDHYNQCPYINQNWNAQVIVCPYEMLYTLPIMIGIHHRGWSEMTGWWGLVIEEEPSRAWFHSMNIKPELLPYIHMSDEQVIPYWGSDYRFFDHIEFKEFETDNIAKYRLFQFIKYYTDHHIHEHRGKFTLFAHRRNMIPSWISYVILNCATTPDSFRRIMFGRTPFSTFVGKSPKMDNNILQIGVKWGVKMGEKYKNGMIDYLKNLSGKSVLMITKKKFEDDFRPYVTDIVHFGSSRGFNDYNNDYNLVVVYGGFHWKPLNRLMYMKLGVMDDIIGELEDAEVIQAVNRCRPYFHPDTPIIMASNCDIVDNIWSSIGQIVLTDDGKDNKYRSSFKNTLNNFTDRFINKNLTRNDLIRKDALFLNNEKLAEKYNLTARTIRRILKCTE